MGIILPEPFDMEPYQTVDRSSTNYKAGYNAAIREIAALKAGHGEAEAETTGVHCTGHVDYAPARTAECDHKRQRWNLQGGGHCDDCGAPVGTSVVPPVPPATGVIVKPELLEQAAHLLSHTASYVAVMRGESVPNDFSRLSDELRALLAQSQGVKS